MTADPHGKTASAVPEPELPPSPADDPAFRIWWHILRPDRQRIADEIDRAARDYRRQDMDQAAIALRQVAGWLRSSAAAFGMNDAYLTGDGQ